MAVAVSEPHRARTTRDAGQGPKHHTGDELEETWPLGVHGWIKKL